MTIREYIRKNLSRVGIGVIVFTAGTAISTMYHVRYDKVEKDISNSNRDYILSLEETIKNLNLELDDYRSRFEATKEREKLRVRSLELKERLEK